MEPERRDSHTYIEREKRTGGSGSAMAFIVGGLVVAVALIALVFWGGDFMGGDGISTQDRVTDVVVPAAPVENNVEIRTDQPATEAQPVAPVEPAPAAPAQN